MPINAGILITDSSSTFVLIHFNKFLNIKPEFFDQIEYDIQSRYIICSKWIGKIYIYYFPEDYTCSCRSLKEKDQFPRLISEFNIPELYGIQYIKIVDYKCLNVSPNLDFEKSHMDTKNNKMKVKLDIFN